MEIDAKLVRDLREKSGAGVMDCKKALAETGGNLDKAIVWLREKGIAAAQKRSGRVASEGTVGSYIHAGGKLGVLVEVNCETDFAAKGPDFQTLVKEIAMQIAATNPRCVRREDLAPEIIEQERQIYAQQSAGKPENVINKIVDGKLDKFYKEVCLLEQSWVRDPNRTITDLIGEYTAKIGEKLDVRRFVRFQLGEAIEQKSAA
ncbi:MAG: translation elongation factor Ts [Candidatus Binataceae bacterium]